MTKGKKKSKKQNGKKVDVLLGKIKNHKLVFVLSLILLTILAFKYPYQMYKDWDNAQLISGLARDFPLLVQEIEDATGLDLEIKSNCSATSEKYSSGVRTCELSVARAQEQNIVDLAINAVKESTVPSSVTLSDSERTYKVEYRNKNSCQISVQGTVYLTCITAVRSANTELAIEEFSKIN